MLRPSISSSVRVSELEIGDVLDVLDVLDELSEDDTSAVDAGAVSVVEVDAGSVVVVVSVPVSDELSSLEDDDDVELEDDVVEDDELEDDELEDDELEVDEFELDELDELDELSGTDISLLL